MKPDLERIQAALNQLETLRSAAYPQSSIVKRRIDSFETFHESPERQFSQKRQSDFSTELQEEDKEPELPHLNTSNSCDCPDTDASQEQVKSLAETQVDVADGKVKLEQVVQQIQVLYYEGPIVDGWLEYYPPAPEPSEGILREIAFECLSEDVSADISLALGEENCKSSFASYRVCGVDASGQQWSYPCPLGQLSSVSIAIARYHKLQQLLQQKHQIETQLKQLRSHESGEQGR